MSRVENHSAEVSMLMDGILEVRFADDAQQCALCRKLMDVAGADSYALAFGHVYLFDGLFALGEYAACAVHLPKALVLCRQHKYDDLHLVLCNNAGLYYLKLNDEQSAMTFYLEGLRLADFIGDLSTKSKLLNNIGKGFAGRGSWKTAQEFFEQALLNLKPIFESTDAGNITSYLSNYAEASQALDEMQHSEEALRYCTRYEDDDLYRSLRLVCGWVGHYSRMGDREKCVACVEQLLKLGLLTYAGKSFVYEMLLTLCDDLLRICEVEYVGFFLETLESFAGQGVVSVYFRINERKIRYYEAVGDTEALDAAYRSYYKLWREISRMDNDTRVKDVLSQIELAQAMEQYDSIRVENKRLRRAGRQDELTGLYNRRYLNTLTQELLESASVHTMGYIMLDVDYFKQYNDFYGHTLGDNVLRLVARFLEEYRTPDIYVSRYGGDEFICLCVNQTDAEVERFICAVTDALKKRDVPHEKSACAKRVTLSIGYSNAPVSSSAETVRLLQAADEALYCAKSKGRDGWAKKELPEEEPETDAEQ